MILGLLAGRIIQGGQLPWQKVRWFVVAGVIGLASGWALGALGICPLVKSLWTSSWVLFSGGWCFLFLAVFYVIGEIWQTKRLLFPFVVLGMNSLAVYSLANLQGQLAPNIFRRLVGSAPFLVLDPIVRTVPLRGLPLDRILVVLLPSISLEDFHPCLVLKCRPRVIIRRLA